MASFIGPEFIVVILLVIAWVVFLVLFANFKLDEKIPLQIYGPFLMLKTGLGKKFIAKVGQRQKFWVGFGFLSFGVVAAAGLLMLLMITLGAWGSTNPQVEPVTLREVLVIPGWNPMIPLGYGLFGLIIAVFIHEGCHGIVTRANKMRVKSLGLLFMIIPVGAFVEPHEEDMGNTTRTKRSMVFAVGPSSNIIFGLVCLLIFSWVFIGSAVPTEDGLIVQGIYKDGPADRAGVEPYWSFVSIDNYKVDSSLDITDFAADPNSTVTLGFVVDDEFTFVDVKWGMYIQSVSLDFPANESGIEAGTYIYSIDGELMRSYEQFHDLMSNTSAGDVINITVLEPNLVYLPGSNTTTEVWQTRYIPGIELEDKAKAYPGFDRFKGKGFLGVSVMPLGMTFVDASAFRELMSRPIMSALDPIDEDTPARLLINVLYVAVILPVQRVLMPIPFDFASNYEVRGPLGLLPHELYWTLANVFYYLFWLNILLGTFNALPMMPLDGGFIFKDVVDYILERVLGKNLLEKAKEGGLMKTLLPVAKFSFRSPSTPLELETDEDFRGSLSFKVAFVVSITCLLLILFSLIMPYINMIIYG